MILLSLAVHLLCGNTLLTMDTFIFLRFPSLSEARQSNAPGEHAAIGPQWIFVGDLLSNVMESTTTQGEARFGHEKSHLLIPNDSTKRPVEGQISSILGALRNEAFKRLWEAIVVTVITQRILGK